MEHLSGQKTYYQYGYDGQRVRKTIEDASAPILHEWFYFGDFEIYRKTDTSTSTLLLERQTLRVMDGETCVAIIDSPVAGTLSSSESQTLRYQLSNNIGSASMELDYEAQIISYEEYYPFGNTSYQAGRSLAEVSLKRYRYVGKERDNETGFYYIGARYYCPWLARWLAVDPINSEWYNLCNGNPQRNKERSYLELTASSYEYCYANPVRFTDPTGEQVPNIQGYDLWNNTHETHSAVNRGDDINVVNDRAPLSPENIQPFKLKVTEGQLKEIFPDGNNEVIKNVVTGLNENMSDFGINSVTKLAHFLAQAGVETGGFTKSSVTESMYYKKADRIEGIFPSYFPGETNQSAKDYVKSPEKLANYVYGDRMGNNGEGFKFIGRGIFQLTGHDNYKAFTDFYQKNYDITKDFVQNPELVASDSKIALISALWYFKTNVLNNLNVERATVEKVTKPINKGLAGLPERKAHYKTAKSVLAR